MLLVDDRAGSVELAAPLTRLGLPVEVCRLNSADIAFVGRGEADEPASVGIEFKLLGELVQALRTERLQGHQLPLMRQDYQFCYLFVEGVWRTNDSGTLLRQSSRSRQWVPIAGRMTQSELHKRLFVLHLKGGLNPWVTQTRKDTLASIRDLYRTWTDKALHEHTSHLGLYVAPLSPHASPLQVTLSTFPGIGPSAARAVEAHFAGSLLRAVNASPVEWAEIRTTDPNGKLRRLGPSVAAQVQAHCRGGA